MVLIGIGLESEDNKKTLPAQGFKLGKKMGDRAGENWGIKNFFTVRHGLSSGHFKMKPLYPKFQLVAEIFHTLLTQYVQDIRQY